MSDEKKIGMALVLDTDLNSGDDYSVQVVDIKSIMPLGDNFYLIQTSTFNDTVINNGAGIPLSLEQKHKILSILSNH